MKKEKRLIDANQLPTQHELLIGRGIVAIVHYSAVENAPTVDAEEVVHGRWIETLVPDGYVQKASRMRKQCSVCGWTNACRYKYCPNCGAKMDK